MSKLYILCFPIMIASFAVADGDLIDVFGKANALRGEGRVSEFRSLCDKDVFGTTAFMCSLELDDNDVFIKRMLFFIEEGSLDNMWVVDSLYNSKNGYEIESAYSNGMVNEIFKRVINIVAVKPELYRESCGLLEKLYDHSDGYFKNDFANFLADSYHLDAVQKCLSEEAEHISSDLRELRLTDE